MLAEQALYHLNHVRPSFGFYTYFSGSVSTFFAWSQDLDYHPLTCASFTAEISGMYHHVQLVD
jgi:hypothetical protein